MSGELTSEEASGRRLAEAFRLLAEDALEKRRGLSMKGVNGAPDWLGYEQAVWHASEELRSQLRRNKKLRGDSALFHMCSQIAADRRFGKGRQNIVAIIGDFGDATHVSLLGTLLGDPEVYGHVIKALAKSRVAGFTDQVAKILEQEKTGWIKSAAKKYLERCEY